MKTFIRVMRAIKAIPTSRLLWDEQNKTWNWDINI